MQGEELFLRGIGRINRGCWRKGIHLLRPNNVTMGVPGAPRQPQRWFARMTMKSRDTRVRHRQETCGGERPVLARRSLRADSIFSCEVCRFDGRSPFLDLACNKFLKVRRRPSVGRGYGGPDLSKPLLDRRGADCGDSGIMKFVNYQTGCAAAQKEREPLIGLNIWHALLLRAR